MQRWLALVALLFSINCSHDDAPGGAGEACGPSRGCADGLTCHQGTCTPIAGSGGAPDGASDGASDGGVSSVADGGHDLAASDGGVVDLGAVGDLASSTDLASVSDLASSPDLACGPCENPPDACHAQKGSCQGGVCVYAFVNGATCDDGDPCTVDDVCQNNGCFGTPRTCNTPPAPICVSASQSKTFDAQGTCSGGLCVYASHTTTCSGGSCVNGACQSDPCAGVTCSTPPSVCYGSAGVCANGSCSYPYADGTACDDGNACTSNDSCVTGVCKGVPKSCGTPPANVCENASTLRVYSSSGSCSAGSCSYSYSFLSCPSGCANGACNPSGWTQMVSNTNQTLLGVWGASANAVWAVGQNGTAVYYDGAKWQVRSLPSQAQGAYMVAVHGTAANNVFALAQKVLIHFDGTQWSFVADVTSSGCTQTSGLFASGDAANDAYVTCWSYSGSGADEHELLLRVSGAGAITQLASSDDGAFGCWYYSGGVWAFSSTDIVTSGCSARQWNGSAISVVGSPSTAVTELWAASPTQLFALDYANGQSGSTVERWDGTSWAPIATGLSGTLSGISGSAANRLFVSGWDSNQKGVILYYDGVGFTQQQLPTGTGQLEAIWAAPTGQVFAVGTGGTILQGP